MKKIAVTDKKVYLAKDNNTYMVLFGEKKLYTSDNIHLACKYLREHISELGRIIRINLEGLE